MATLGSGFVVLDEVLRIRHASLIATQGTGGPHPLKSSWEIMYGALAT